MVKAGAMALKAVVPGIPKSAKDRELLEEDLRTIRCLEFMGKPWGIRMEDLVVELLGEKDNRWHETVCQALEKWTAKEWRKVYGFAREGEGMASWTDRFIDGKFFGRVNPKDGYAVVDCKEPKARKVLEFLVPLLYPEKSTRITIMVGNTIFGALIRGETGRLGSSSKRPSAEANFRDGEVQGNTDLPLCASPLPLARAATPSREEGVPDQGGPPKTQRRI